MSTITTVLFSHYRVYRTLLGAGQRRITKLGGETSYPKTSGVTTVAAGFAKDGSGWVALKGLVKGGNIPKAIFILPAGYRPKEDIVFEVHSEDSSGSVPGSSVMVKTTGDVIVKTGGNSLLSLNNIGFVAEQ